MEPAVERAALAVERLHRAEAEAQAAIRDALKDAPHGRQAELVRATGYSREHLRQIARDMAS